MNRLTQLTMPWLLMLLILVGGCGCGSGKSDLCCLTYEEESQQRYYCNNHRTAVVSWVRARPSDEDRRARLEQFLAFVPTVENCTTVACISAAIDAASDLDGFAAKFHYEHDFAEQDAVVSQDQKAGLILCGFKNATDGMRQTLLGEE